MKRFLIISIALVSLITMGSPVMADGVSSGFGPGNSGVTGFPNGDPNCLSDFVTILGIDLSDVGLSATLFVSNAFETATFFARLGGDGDCAPFLGE